MGGQKKRKYFDVKFADLTNETNKQTNQTKQATKQKKITDKACQE